MNKFSLKQVAAVAVLAGASVGANATTTDLGTITNNTPVTFSGVIQGSGIGINDIFTFNFEQPNVGSGYDVVNVPLTFSPNANFNTALATMTLMSNDNGIVGDFDDAVLKSTVLPSPGNSSDNLSLTWDLPITGPAYINITGITNGSEGGIYAGAIAAAVPEPETYAMLLAGLGLMGAVVRRRGRKTS
jgi:hypothetical protein